LERYRPAHQASVPDSRSHFGGIAFNLHAAAATVAELTARKVGVERGAVDFKAGWKPLDDAGETGSVGLSGGCQRNRHWSVQASEQPLFSAGEFNRQTAA
jgi:hypothetical protein